MMGRPRLPLTALALAGVLGQAAAAQEPGSLIAANPANRSGQAEVSQLIAQLIAERSGSVAVRARAARAPQWGRLEVGADEILAEIGAANALGTPPARPAPVPPPATVAAPAPVRVAPPPPRFPTDFVRPTQGGRGAGRSGGGSGGGGGAGGW